MIDGGAEVCIRVASLLEGAGLAGLTCREHFCRLGAASGLTLPVGQQVRVILDYLLDCGNRLVAVGSPALDLDLRQCSGVGQDGYQRLAVDLESLSDDLDPADP